MGHEAVGKPAESELRRERRRTAAEPGNASRLASGKDRAPNAEISNLLLREAEGLGEQDPNSPSGPVGEEVGWADLAAIGAGIGSASRAFGAEEFSIIEPIAFGVAAADDFRGSGGFGDEWWGLRSRVIRERAVLAGIGLGAGDPYQFTAGIHYKGGFLRWGAKIEGDGIAPIAVGEEGRL